MKHFLFITVMTLSISATAQKGSFYIGGSGGFNNRSFNKSDLKSTSWNFSPEVGTFLTDNVQVGVGVKFSGLKNAGLTNSQLLKYEYVESSTGATLYGRYFFKPGNAFRPFVGLNVDILPSKVKFDYEDNSQDSESKVFDLGANLNAGFSYALTSKWSVLGSFAALGFNRSKAEGSGVVTTDFGLNINTLGNRFTIGFYYTL